MSSFLFINQYFWPDEAATSQLLLNLAEDLIHAGHEVTVICGRAHYSTHEIGANSTPPFRGVRIERINGTNFGRHRWHGRLGDIFSFSMGAKRRLNVLPPVDVVIAMSSPPLAGRLAIKFCRKHQIPLVLWIHDIYPELAERCGLLKDPISRRWLYRKARELYGASSKIIIPGERMQESLMSYKEANGKIRVIPNWADLVQIDSGPVLENRFRKVQGWGEEPVVMYAGNLGKFHEVKTMLELLVLMQMQLPSLRIALVGDFKRYSAFILQAEKMGLKYITYLPHQPREELENLLGAADVHLVSQKSESNGLLVPSKFYNVVAAGRPVIFIGPQNSEIGAMITNFNLGTVIAPGQASSGLPSALRVLHGVRSEKWMVPYVREWAKAHASRKMSTEKIRILLEESIAC